MATATVRIADVPFLPRNRADQEHSIAALAEAFGRDVVASGLADAGDMPSEKSYRIASRIAVRIMSEDEVSIALLVNLIAERIEIGAREDD